jgi:sigma-B regulation protein RsbU (phosphoserine phosphatase)
VASDSSGLTAETKYRLLLRISEKISGSLELQEVLDHLLDTVGSIIPYDAAGIFVLRERVRPLAQGSLAHMVAGVATRGFEPRGPEGDSMLVSGCGIVGYTMRTGCSVVCADIRCDPRYVEGRKKTLSEIAVPIIINQVIIGALNLESDRLGAFTDDDLEVLQFSANAAAASIERAILHDQVMEKRRIERQLEIARQVQAGLLPKRPPVLSGYDIAAIHLPTWEIGGDCYDYIELPNGRVGIAIADVSGKGVPAALIMATFRAALRTRVRYDLELAHVLQSVNRLLCESIASSAFVSAFFGILDPASGRFLYANAGHNPPLLLRPGQPCQTLDRGGPPLGVLETSLYEVGEVILEPSATLSLYTDGVVEVAEAGESEFGVERLEETLRDSAALSAEEMIGAIVGRTQHFSGARLYADDFTIVVVKRAP